MVRKIILAVVFNGVLLSATLFNSIVEARGALSLDAFRGSSPAGNQVVLPIGPDWPELVRID